MACSVLRQSQGTTQEVQNGVARPGEWILSGFEGTDSPVIVPLMFARARELRANNLPLNDPRYVQDNTVILCQSTDGRVGR